MYFDYLILKVTNVRLGAVREPHLGGEMLVVMLKLLTRGVLGEKQSSEILEAVN